MTQYYVHTYKDDDGDYEVHKPECNWLPKPDHRVYLGEFSKCSSAIVEAENRGFKPANGCYHCNRECHTS